MKRKSHKEDILPILLGVPAKWIFLISVPLTIYDFSYWKIPIIALFVFVTSIATLTVNSLRRDGKWKSDIDIN